MATFADKVAEEKKILASIYKMDYQGNVGVRSFKQLKGINKALGLDENDGIDDLEVMRKNIQIELDAHEDAIMDALTDVTAGSNESIARRKKIVNERNIIYYSLLDETDKVESAESSLRENNRQLGLSSNDGFNEVATLTATAQEDFQGWESGLQNYNNNLGAPRQFFGPAEFVDESGKPRVIGRTEESQRFEPYERKAPGDDQKGRLDELEESFAKRLEMTKSQREQDRVEAQERAASIFTEGVLGRVEQDVPQELTDLIEGRRGRISDLEAAQLADMLQREDINQLIRDQFQTGGDQRAELIRKTREETYPELNKLRDIERARVESEYDQLISSRKNLNDPFYTALREKGLREIADQEKAAMGKIREINTGGNVRRGDALMAEVLQGSSLARSALERDLTIEARTGLERLTGEAAAARDAQISKSVNEQMAQSQQLSDLMAQSAETGAVEGGLLSDIQAQKEGLRSQQVGQTELFNQRLEDVIGAVRQDSLNREIINLQNQASELFGRLQTEETGVAQGIAERSGVRQELLAEANLAEQERHNIEQEKTQRIEAEKPPPSAGGGKSVLCIAHWARGTFSKAILDADMEYSKNVDDDVRRGYYWLCTDLADMVLDPEYFTESWMPEWLHNICHDLAYKMTKPIVEGWAFEMAHRMGQLHTGNWIGKAICFYGVPMCRLLGKTLKLLGKKDVVTDNGWKYWDAYLFDDPHKLTNHKYTHVK